MVKHFRERRGYREKASHTHIPTHSLTNIGLIALSVVVLGLGYGCRSKTPELTFMTGGTPHEIAFWEALCNDFERDTGIHVELLRSTTQTAQRKQQIQVGLRGKRPDPDVFTMDIAWIAQLAHSEWLEPLDQHNIDATPFYQNVIELADTYRGDLVAIPLWLDAGLLYYREDLLTTYDYDGPPETWDELIEMASHIQAAERKENPRFWGYAWQGAQYEGLVCNALEVFISSGGRFFDADGNPTLTDPANQRALATMVSFIHDAKISPPNVYTDMQEEEARLLFHNGDALFQRNWPYAIALHESDDSPIQGMFSVTTLPHVPGHSSAATLGGWHVAISRFSDRKDDAAAFVRYLGSYDVQKRLALEQSYNPGRKDVYADDEVAGTRIGQLAPIFKAAVPRPQLPTYPQVSMILQKHLSAALARQASPEEALAGAQREVSAFLQSLELE